MSRLHDIKTHRKKKHSINVPEKKKSIQNTFDSQLDELKLKLMGFAK